MVKLGSFCNTVVDKTFSMRQRLAQSRKSLYWALLNFVFAFILYSDLFYHRVGIFGDYKNLLVLFSEYVIASALTLNILVDVFKYIWPRFFSPPVILSEQQQRLLGVKKCESGFRLSTSGIQDPVSSNDNLIFNTSICSTHSGYMSGSISPVSHQSTPAWARSPFGPSNFSFSPDLSQAYSPPSNNSTFASSNNSPYFITNRSSLSPAPSPWTRGITTPAGLHSRNIGSRLSRSPVSPNERITDESSLNRFLKEEDVKQYKSYLTSSDQTNHPGSFWIFNRTAGDYSRVLRRYEYQIASRSPQLSAPDDRDDLQYAGTDMWDKFGVTEDTHTLWMEKLREWLCTTIIARVAKEIQLINKRLARIGCEDMQIGEVSVSTLKQLAITKSLHVPTLNTLIPYLEISTNQTYIVKRLHHLAKGGCMSDYDWNGGGMYGKPWSENLPNDATLLAHEFCTYMDSRLPADAKYPDGKTFTSQCFLKTPEKPNLTKEDNLLLYQSKIHPPHFNVVVGGEIWPVHKGRNNLFNAILLFLYHIKIQHHGMLGRINLGISGVNMLHILDSKENDGQRWTFTSDQS